MSTKLPLCNVAGPAANVVCNLDQGHYGQHTGRLPGTTAGHVSWWNGCHAVHPVFHVVCNRVYHRPSEPHRAMHAGKELEWIVAGAAETTSTPPSPPEFIDTTPTTTAHAAAPFKNWPKCLRLKADEANTAEELIVDPDWDVLVVCADQASSPIVGVVTRAWLEYMLAQNPQVSPKNLKLSFWTPLKLSQFKMWRRQDELEKLEKGTPFYAE